MFNDNKIGSRRYIVITENDKSTVKNILSLLEIIFVTILVGKKNANN